MNNLVLLIACIVSVFSDLILVWWAKSDAHQTKILIFGVASINVSCLLWAYSMFRGVSPAVAITVYSILTVVGCTLVGYYFFNEALSFINVIGIILAVIALVFISL